MEQPQQKKEYFDNTSFIYGTQAWGPHWQKGDGVFIEFTDNNAKKYILESLKIMNISEKELANKVVFNIGTGRESKIFQEMGAKFVTHFDIANENVNSMQSYIKEKQIKNMESIRGDIQHANLEPNKYDIIFLAGIYQHIQTPADALVTLINALKPDGVMYMGFYRSGEWKYFIVDAIRYLVDHNMFAFIKTANMIFYTFGQNVHYQMSRVLDDFFVPFKHNFHPNDVIHDIELLGGSVYYFDGDFRDYQHEGDQYFSIGGDRIYITKKNKTNTKLEDVFGLKTKTGRDQIFDVDYREEIIKENIQLIKKIKQRKDYGFISAQEISLLCLSLYQFTRPFIPGQNEYYQISMKEGRHNALNRYLKNFIQSISQSE